MIARGLNILKLLIVLNIKMNRPIEPKLPVMPPTPDVNYYCEEAFYPDFIHNKLMTLDELVSFIKEAASNHENIGVRFYTEHTEHYGDMLNLVKIKDKKNPNYNKEIKKYNARAASFEKKMTEYKRRRAIYLEDMKLYNAECKADEIARLNKRIKELSK